MNTRHRAFWMGARWAMLLSGFMTGCAAVLLWNARLAGLALIELAVALWMWRDV